MYGFIFKPSFIELKLWALKVGEGDELKILTFDFFLDLKIWRRSNHVREDQKKKKKKKKMK